jgi:hypothetical protein
MASAREDRNGAKTSDRYLHLEVATRSVQAPSIELDLLKVNLRPDLDIP